MTVDKLEFAWEFHQLSCPGQTRTIVAWELTSESLHESFINSHILVKREQELHESWQARVYMRASSTPMSWSNVNKSCMSVDKRELAWEFHQLSCPGQTRTRVAWELTSERLHESFINSHVLVKREQELYESWQARVRMRVWLNAMPWSNEKTSCKRVDGLSYNYVVWLCARVSKCKIYIIQKRAKNVENTTTYIEIQLSVYLMSVMSVTLRKLSHCQSACSDYVCNNRATYFISGIVWWSTYRAITKRNV